MKSLIAIGCGAAIASMAITNAATVAVSPSFGTVNGIIAMDMAGAPIDAGGYAIAVGSYDTEPVVTDFASLLSAVGQMNIFDVQTSPDSLATQGTISGAFTSLGAPNPGLFNNQQIYFVVGNGVDIASSTEFGIFKVAATFPPDVTQAGSTPVVLGNVGAIEALPNAGTPISNAGARDNFQLVGIPEPSAALLGLLGVVGLLRRRR